MVAILGAVDTMRIFQMMAPGFSGSKNKLLIVFVKVQINIFEVVAFIFISPNKT